jgi:hypothetical protein
MRAAGMEVREVWPAEVLAGQMEPLREAIDWLGLDWSEAGIRDLCDPTLFTAGSQP